MTEISRVALFGKLNKVGYQAVEGATVFCKMRGNPYVEIIHWLAQLVQVDNSDVQKITRCRIVAWQGCVLNYPSR